MKNDELRHFGILGMKWGLRKAKASGSDTSSEDHRTTSSLKKKKLSEMSNEELKKLTTRLQLEKQYKDLSKADIDPGKKFLADVLVGVMKQQSISMLNVGIGNAGKIIKETLEEKTK